ncbi:hypothetical protein GCM10010245_88350 [Streptomyces spectabilis]|nr:hypothetical protein GCM10010245_88350 [Streptomyces spectabilis]
MRDPGSGAGASSRRALDTLASWGMTPPTVVAEAAYHIKGQAPLLAVRDLGRDPGFRPAIGVR